MTLSGADVANILAGVLYEFPVREIGIALPRYIGALPQGHKVKDSVYGSIRQAARDVHKMRDMQTAAARIGENEYISVPSLRIGSWNRKSAAKYCASKRSLLRSCRGENWCGHS